jgi:sugar phosphate isomerase/epimerase
MAACKGPRTRPFLKTLNVGDYPWAVDDYNAGTCGHRAKDFVESCELAAKHGFDATNLHIEYLRAHGPDAVKALLAKHGLQPGATRFPVKLTDEASDAEFDASLGRFEEEAPLLAAAGYTTLAYHLLPWSEPRDSGEGQPFHPHFRRTAERLARVVPTLERHGLRVALECIGAFGLRRVRQHSFVHTIEGVRSLIAAASAERCVGLKFDVFHWHVCGGQLAELVKLAPSEIVYGAPDARSGRRAGPRGAGPMAWGVGGGPT